MRTSEAKLTIPFEKLDQCTLGPKRRLLNWAGSSPSSRQQARNSHDRAQRKRPAWGERARGEGQADYWIELATAENTLFDSPPINFRVPITTTTITASMTAYSATSWPLSSDHTFDNTEQICCTVGAPFVGLGGGRGSTDGLLRRQEYALDVVQRQYAIKCRIPAARLRFHTTHAR
jgi:hypothetical protein